MSAKIGPRELALREQRSKPADRGTYAPAAIAAKLAAAVAAIPAKKPPKPPKKKSRWGKKR